MAEILSGKEVANKINSETTSFVVELSKIDITPKLSVILSTGNESTIAYTSSISKACERLGIVCEILDLGANAKEEDISRVVTEKSNQNEVHGIIIQTPLPDNVDALKIREIIPPNKDVDGANPTSFGLVSEKATAFAPATAQAVIEMLKYYNIDPAQKDVVVIGRSNVVGKPLSQLLINLDATVTMCHSKTPNIEDFSIKSDIVITAVGKPKLFGKNYFNVNSIVIDVGTNFDSDGKLVGDVDFQSVEPHVSKISPVPGGIGPITTSVLLKNVCIAAKFAY